MKRDFIAAAIKPLDQRLRACDARKIKAGAGRRADRDLIEPRSMVPLREKELIACRRKYRAQHRLSVLDQRHADTPVLTAGKIGTGAVDRIDDPDQALAKARLAVGAFLGQPAIIRRGGLQL